MRRCAGLHSRRASIAGQRPRTSPRAVDLSMGNALWQAASGARVAWDSRSSYRAHSPTCELLQTCAPSCLIKSSPASWRVLERAPSAPTTSLALTVWPLSRPTSASLLLCAPADSHPQKLLAQDTDGMPCSNPGMILSKHAAGNKQDASLTVHLIGSLAHMLEGGATAEKPACPGKLLLIHLLANSA